MPCKTFLIKNRLRSSVVRHPITLRFFRSLLPRRGSLLTRAPASFRGCPPPVRKTRIPCTCTSPTPLLLLRLSRPISRSTFSRHFLFKPQVFRIVRAGCITEGAYISLAEGH